MDQGEISHGESTSGNLGEGVDQERELSNRYEVHLSKGPQRISFEGNDLAVDLNRKNLSDHQSLNRK